MGPRDAFKAGFYLRAAEAGLGPEAADLLAAGKLTKSAGSLMETLGGLGATGAMLAAVAPPVLGYGGGWLAAKATDTPYDPADLRTQELIDEYRRLASRARRQAMLKRHAASGGVDTSSLVGHG